MFLYYRLLVLRDVVALFCLFAGRWIKCFSGAFRSVDYRPRIELVILIVFFNRKTWTNFFLFFCLFTTCRQISQTHEF